MSAYKDNPQLALLALEKIAEEIPSGVSAHDVGQIVPRLGSCPDEITDNLRESIASELKSNIQAFWSSHNVSEKLEMVKNLKCTEGDVRPPTSRQEMLNSINAKYLKQLKEGLVTRLEKIKKENEELEKCLKIKADLIEKQMEDVKVCDFTL